MHNQPPPSLEQLKSASDRVFELAATKTRSLDSDWDTSRGTPVFTVDGKYTARGWTEWTQGFQYGCMILTGDAIGDDSLIHLGRERTTKLMLPHVTHVGVHDHGFNNLSTYGNLLRLMKEGRLAHDPWEEQTYANAIAASGAVQASRWASTNDDDADYFGPHGGGYVTSFNGPHSLFVDTMRTIRILGVAHQLGHYLMGEGDQKFSLLSRLVTHALTTARYIVFDGNSEHTYDIRGRTAHEAIFNRAQGGQFRCRSTQQGYSPFSTWTRGLAWAMLGYAEELEFFRTLDEAEFENETGLKKSQVVEVFERTARATCDHYIGETTAADGIPYWDDGAPNLYKLGDWQNAPADPYNDHEPVDSSAAAIAAQGLVRLGQYLGAAGEGKRYFDAGLSVAKTLFEEPYLSTNPSHQGLLLHSIYHQPNGWDHVPAGRKIACDESSMWGDYHLLELALLVRRMANGDAYLKFYL